MRIRLFPPSATYTFPFKSTATPCGLLKIAAVPNPFAYPKVPLPARVDTLIAVVFSAVTATFSADVTLLAVALQTALMDQLLPEPVHVSPPVQYAVHELLPTHCAVIRSMPFVQPALAGQTAEDAQRKHADVIDEIVLPGSHDEKYVSPYDDPGTAHIE